MARPPILYDFHGFPPELYQLAYPAAGAPDLARRVAALLAPDPVVFDTARGLDHGAWSVLLHLWPQADVPVVQLRLDRARRPADHVRLAARLAPLRDEGVMVIGSGNVVHNLRAYRWDRGLMAEPYDWALRFERQVRERIAAGDLAGLADYLAIGPDAALAVPTPEHYLPLLYVLALRRPDDPVRFPSEGMDGGAVSMLAVQVG
jgi:4,5-DOPA dioxygenase extradiol